MNHPNLLILSLCVLFSTVSVRSTTLDSLLDKHRTAVGGRDAALRVSRYVVKGKYISSDGSWKKSMTMTVKGTKLRTEMVMQPGMSMVRAFDGTSGWSIVPWTGSLDPQPLNAEDSKSLASTNDIILSDLIIGNDAKRTLRYEGTEDFEGSECHRIVARHTDGLEREFFLDGDSYLVLKVTTRYRFQDTDHESTSVYGNYKRFGGLLLPTALEGEGGGGVYVSEVTMNPAIDDSVFAMPAATEKK
ncbi:MAG: hypothetical protein ACKOBV_00290 [Candidatus Kapaibacterium sp.]